MNRWASRPLATSASDFLAALRSEIPVSLIATPRVDLKCQRKSRWQEIETDATLVDFDQVPLTSKDGVHIEAVFVRGSGPVELREDMFMAANAPLISFLESADYTAFRFLVSDRSVLGLVTLSDIQKLPAYSVLFGVLIGVEMLLMDWIRKACRDREDAWLQHLSARQRGNVEKHWKAAIANNVAIDRLSCASFGQEIQAAAGLGLFNEEQNRKNTFLTLEALRHQVCHAADFAPTPELARGIPPRVRDAHDSVRWLESEIERLWT